MAGGGRVSPTPGTSKGEERTMALKPYDVVVYGHQTTLLLSDEDAKREGLLKEPEAKKAPARPNKARTAANKKD